MDEELEEGGGNKIDIFDVGVVFAFVAAFMGDISFFLIITHYVAGIFVLGFFWPKTKGFIAKLILLIAFIVPLPLLMVGMFLALIFSNKIFAIVAEQVIIQGIAVATAGAGETLEGAAATGAAAEAAATAAEAGGAAATAGEAAAEGATATGEAATEAGGAAGEGSSAAEGAAEGGSGEEFTPPEERNPMENLQEELTEPQEELGGEEKPEKPQEEKGSQKNEESEATKKAKKAFDTLDRLDQQQRNKEEEKNNKDADWEEFSEAA